MTDDALMALGAEAKQAKPYVTSLMDRVKGIILDHIINLAPDDTMRFTVYKSQMLCLEDVLATVEADVKAGQRVIEEMQGSATASSNGIL